MADGVKGLREVHKSGEQLSALLLALFRQLACRISLEALSFGLNESEELRKVSSAKE